MAHHVYNWARFWGPRDDPFPFTQAGFLVDPESLEATQYSGSLLSFAALEPYPVLALLGEPGIGKTTAIEAACQTVQARIQTTEDQILPCDLRAYGSDTELRNDLFRCATFQAWIAGTHQLHLFLDSLDECRLRIDNVAQVLIAGLQGCPVERLFLRISCRTAEWPTFLEDKLRQIWLENESLRAKWGDNIVGVYKLAPLTRRDVEEAAQQAGINATAFLEEIARLEVVPFASTPITLKFLLKTYRKSHTFPAKQAKLYEEGCLLLCEEVNPSRVTSRLTGGLSSRQRMIIAARIAAITIFGNRYAVWTDTPVEDNPYEDDDISLTKLAGGEEAADGATFPVTRAGILETLDTGLFSVRGRARISWAHQTYAEFLAAWYLMQHDMTTDQIMSLVMHPDDRDQKLVVQLHGIATWLASLDPGVFLAIIKCDPEVLLGINVTTADPEYRTQLVESLLDQYERGDLLDNDWERYNLYHKLDHPDLATQLRPYITTARRNSIVRSVAIDIAEVCQITSLNQELADLALNPAEPMAQRINAAVALMKIGDAAAKARLRPLLFDPIHAGIEEELRGAALLALWPESITATELFAALIPPDGDLITLYSRFFYGSEMKHLQSADVAVALAWVEALPTKLREDLTYQHIVDAIMLQAWQFIEILGVREPLARLLLSRDPHAIHVAGRDAVAEAVRTDDEKRHLLVKPFIDLVIASRAELSHIVWKRLVLSKDIPWLLAILVTDGGNQLVQQTLAKLCQAALIRDDNSSLEAIYETAQHSTILAEQFAWLLKGINIHSEEAETLKVHYQQQHELELLDQDRPSHNPSLIPQVLTLLDRFEQGDLSGWWRLNMVLIFDPNARQYEHKTVSDLTVLPGWQIMDVDAKTRALRAANTYLREQEPEIAKWLGQNVIYYPAYAAFRALRLLLNEEPATFNALPITVWQKWAPITLAYVHTGASARTQEVQQHRLVASAYTQAPDEVISSLLALIDYENRVYSSTRVLECIESCWDAAITNALAEKLYDPQLTPVTFNQLLEMLLKRGNLQAKHFVEELLSDPIPTHRLEHAVGAAKQLALWSVDASWGLIWSVIEDNTEFGKKVLERLITEHHRDARSFPHGLSTAQLADLFIWLENQYPTAQDAHPKGVHIVSVREDVQHWRDSLPHILARRGTVEAVTAMRRIMEKLPHLSYLEYILYEAKAVWRRSTWMPLQPEILLKLVRDQQTHLVQNADQLLQVVMESLRRLEQDLQGNTAIVNGLWNYTKEGNKKTHWRPKDENEFSDYVKVHLQRDIKRKGIILNREAEIRAGQELDIYVEAVAAPTNGSDTIGDTVSVVIESKCCWHNDLDTAMQNQLVDTYIKGSNCHAGLYLVAWFNCPKWDEEDNRQKAAQKQAPNKDQLQVQLSAQANTLSTRDLHIKALVLNTGLFGANGK